MRKLPKILSYEEYLQLQQYLKKHKPCNWEQYSLAMMLAFESGLRISEIVGLKKRECRKCGADIEVKRVEVEG